MKSSNSRILVLGASGMLGNTLLRYFATRDGFDVYGTARSPASVGSLSDELKARIFFGIDAENMNHLLRVFSEVRPEVVINCIGVVKQLSASEDPLSAIPINALLPHRLAHLANTREARVIHVSTDCVFSGSKGAYTEKDLPDATDLYGRSKLIGEIDYPNAITLRTSLIGHELYGARSLISWFLSQQGAVKGFNRAVFSGLPTVEMARVIEAHVLPNPELSGLYHLSSYPISKFDLLTLVAKIYEKKIDIVPDESVVIDRSLDCEHFRSATGYSPKPWPELIRAMQDFR